MFKQYRLIVALVIIGLVGGVYGSQVDASASAGNPNQGKETEQQSNKDSYEQRWEAFIQKCFGQWQSQKNDQKEQEQQQPDSTDQQEVDQKEEDQTEEVKQPQPSEEDSNATEEQVQEQEKEVEETPVDETDKRTSVV